MKAKKDNRLLVRMIFLWILIVSVSGCEKSTRHKVLTFFFTGVPPLEEEVAVEEKDVLEPSVVEEMQALKRPFVSHPTFLERKCELCHEAAIGFSMPGQRNKWDGIFRKGGGMPGPLLLPLENVCLNCHEDLSAVRAHKEGLWLHTPAAQGGCTKCHDPHQSRNPFVLLEDPEKVCLPCHSQDLAITMAEDPKKPKECPEYHNEPKPCLSCHNPHLGADGKLLVKDYKEEKHSAAPMPAMSGPNQKSGTGNTPDAQAAPPSKPQ